MEFEKSASTTTEDIARSEIPRLTIEPVHTSVKPETISAPSVINDEAARQSFSFDAEATVGLLAENKPEKQRHTFLIIALSLATTATVLAALYLFMPR